MSQPVTPNTSKDSPTTTADSACGRTPNDANKWTIELDRAAIDAGDRRRLLQLLGDIAWREFDKRREYEWKFNLALWASLGALAGFTAQHTTMFRTAEKFMASIILVAIGLIYTYIWSRGLLRKNRHDQKAAAFYWSHLELELKHSKPNEQLKGPFCESFETLVDQPHLGKASISTQSRELTGSWSHGTQIAITWLMIALVSISLGLFR